MTNAVQSNIEHVAEETAEEMAIAPWLAPYVDIAWNHDDVDALLTSIDASQSPETSMLPHLPAELLLHILEYIPIDYVLDWRLICRGFRDAIDGRILYYHLRRTRLIGYLGARDSIYMRSLSGDAYERLHLVYANFHSVEDVQLDPVQEGRVGPIWSGKHAVFKIDKRWYKTYQRYKDSSNNSGADYPRWSNMLERLMVQQVGRGFGSLSWAISLDTAVLDLDLPLESGRGNFEVDVDTKKWIVRVEWREMLFRFIQTETSLRHLTETSRDSAFTFSLAEDTLRAIRRQRLQAALDPDSKIDRHIKWSLRLLQPLFGKPGHNDLPTLGNIETDAVGCLLLLRRKAALSERQIQHLYQLAADYKAIAKTMDNLSRSVRALKSQLILPGNDGIVEVDVPLVLNIPRNPIAWSDELRTDIETRVRRWKTQRDVIEQMQALMITSQEALAIPEDAFDVMDADF